MAGVVKSITVSHGIITAASGGTVDTADITAKNVTYATIQDASAGDVLLGRGSSGGAGTYQEITLGSGLSMTGTVLSSSGGGGSGTVTSITAGAGLSGGTITTTGTISMPNVGTANTYGDSAHFVSITTDAQGRVTAVTPFSVPSGTVSSITASSPLTGGTIT